MLKVDKCSFVIPAQAGIQDLGPVFQRDDRTSYQH